jgi:solute carrier family 35 protein C2
MQRKDIGLSNPIDMIYYIQPWMICSLIPLVLGVEILPVFSATDPEAVWSSSSEEFRGEDFIMEKVICVIIGALLAFLMELSEYLLLTYTSSLTLSIAGIFKEAFTLFLAFEYNGDPFNSVNFIGLLLCMTGIVLHVAIKVTDVSGL